MKSLTLYKTYKLWIEAFSKRAASETFSDIIKKAIEKHPVLGRQIFHIPGTKYHGLHPDEKPVFMHLERAANIVSVHKGDKHKRWKFKRGISKSCEKVTNDFLKQRFAELLSLNLNSISEEVEWQFEVSDPHYVVQMTPVPYLDGKLLYRTNYGHLHNPQFGTFPLPATKGNYIPVECENQSPVHEIMIPTYLALVSTNGYARIFNTETGFVGPEKLAYLNVVTQRGQMCHAAEAISKADWTSAEKSGLVKLYDSSGVQQGGLSVVPETTHTFSGISLTAKNTIGGHRYAVVKSGEDLLTSFEITQYHIRPEAFLLCNESDKWGFWNAEHSDWVVKPIWDELPEYLCDDCRVVSIKGKKGALRTLDYSKEIVPCLFERVTYLKPREKNLQHPFYLIGEDLKGAHSLYSRQGILIETGLTSTELDAAINNP